MPSGIRVLIVEDEALVAATLSDAVENAGSEVAGVAYTILVTLQKPVVPRRIVAEILWAREKGLSSSMDHAKRLRAAPSEGWLGKGFA